MDINDALRKRPSQMLANNNRMLTRQANQLHVGRLQRCNHLPRHAIPAIAPSKEITSAFKSALSRHFDTRRVIAILRSRPRSLLSIFPEAMLSAMAMKFEPASRTAKSRGRFHLLFFAVAAELFVAAAAGFAFCGR